MELIYQLQQTSQTKTNQIHLLRHFQLFRLNDKYYFYILTVKDLFDCVIKKEAHGISFSARYQRRLERAIKSGKYLPIEDFTTEEYPFHTHEW